MVLTGRQGHGSSDRKNWIVENVSSGREMKVKRLQKIWRLSEEGGF